MSEHVVENDADLCPCGHTRDQHGAHGDPGCDAVIATGTYRMLCACSRFGCFPPKPATTPPPNLSTTEGES